MTITPDLMNKKPPAAAAPHQTSGPTMFALNTSRPPIALELRGENLHMVVLAVAKAVAVAATALPTVVVEDVVAAAIAEAEDT
jgi:hypothetical protein